MNHFKAGDSVMCIDTDEVAMKHNQIVHGGVYKVSHVYQDIVELEPDGRGVLYHRFELCGVSAKKESTGKSPLELLAKFPGLKDVAAIFELGLKKYPDVNGDFNFRQGKGKPEYKMRLLGAAMRHMFAWAQGDKIDKESGMPHLAHAACNLLMVGDIEILESK